MKEKHYLTPLLEPRSVGIIGASEREASLGSVLMRNMLEAGYKGKLFADQSQARASAWGRLLQVGRGRAAAPRPGGDHHRADRRRPSSTPAAAPASRR
jgi:hypothetical protein